jgi:hypothetical protein
MAEYGQLTRSDLAAFDKEATGLILSAIAAGCTGNVSRRTHAILRNAAGDTMSVQRKLATGNRSSQNTRSEYKKFMAAHTEALEAQGVTPTPVEVEPEEAPAEDFWFCTLCQESLPLSGQDESTAQQAHMAEVHPKYTFCPECGALVKKQGLGPHINMAHKVTTEQRRANAIKAGETRRRAREEAEKAAQEAQEPAEEPVSPPVEEITDEQVAEILEHPDEPQIELPEPEISHQFAVETIEKIRNLLGKDPRVVELEAQIVVITEERDAAIKAKGELEAKLALMREAFDA